MYIDVAVTNGIEYASVVESFREGSSIKKRKIRYLGRVLMRLGKNGEAIFGTQNREGSSSISKGIFKNKNDGIFMYDINDEGKGKEIKRVPPQYDIPVVERKNAARRRPIKSVVFGDIYLVDKFIKECGICSSINAINPANLDSLYSLIEYYILENLSNCYADDWWNCSYVKYLYPKAKLTSQRISELLEDIGTEDAKQNFFKEYLKFVETIPTSNPQNNSEDDSKKKKLKYTVQDGILIDSTGLPNVAHLAATAVNNHNGVVSEEVRLVYVVQQHSGLPLFYRYVPGNIIDASTIKRTIAELKKYGVKTNWSILDAGYYNKYNADALCKEKISFITRLKKDAKVFTDALEQYGDKIQDKKNAVLYNGRLYYIKSFSCKIGSNKNYNAYGYLCLDMKEKNAQVNTLLNKAYDDGLTGDEIHDEVMKKGFFMLLSTRKLTKEDVLKLYYTRDQIEKIFEICKQDSNILPINVEKDETFRGHLMITFIAAVIVKLMLEKSATSKYSTRFIFSHLKRLSAIIHDDCLLINEPEKKMKEIYKIFKIKIPEIIQLSL